MADRVIRAFGSRLTALLDYARPGDAIVVVGTTGLAETPPRYDHDSRTGRAEHRSACDGLRLRLP